ncbi:ArnT family glycosyltransferase [Sphingomonas sp. UNC305MFCol5.2]|uniref:ArnT family glycosyltransferase n=1 Tax=Sphingomonas sp. UNC305MFCol5.2 TaxID=1449076 RepID=UPI0018CC5C47|nr:glycosyltransferase family 39 protein [Sphingomonas sp. UNC305MFCol5.2]
MTEPTPPARNAGRDSWTQHSLLLLILLAAAGLRIRGIGFGLPALYDPDEPLFMMTAIEMLRNNSLNPGWFGHPGTITLYCLALTDLIVGSIGIATGRYADADAFVRAAYADPGILFLPARILIATFGVVCVYLTWRLGRRIGGTRTGLLAAAFLAVNAVHIEYSQLIRTDIQASVFMLLCLSSALSIAESGRLRAYLLAGIFVGLGCATKWPAATFALSPIAAGIWRVAQGKREARNLLAFAGAAVATLFLASPYLLLDYPAVVRNLTGEARPIHPGSTGGGLLDNFGWYLRSLFGSFGAINIALATFGTILLPLRNRGPAIALLPGAGAFAVLISIQTLRWERWLVPLLPFVAIMTGYAVHALSDMARAWTGRSLRLVEPLAGLLLILPMLPPVQDRAVARANDTRQLASAWIRAHVPSDASIVVEHAALDLIDGPWKLLFPLGSAGCVDARAMLTGRIRYAEVETLRSGSPIVDLASVPSPRLESCHARYAVLTHYDRYRDAQADFAAEWRRYAALTRRSTLRATITPADGERAGPAVYIFELAPRHRAVGRLSTNAAHPANASATTTSAVKPGRAVNQKMA